MAALTLILPVSTHTLTHSNIFNFGYWIPNNYKYSPVSCREQLKWDIFGAFRHILKQVSVTFTATCDNNKSHIASSESASGHLHSVIIPDQVNMKQQRTWVCSTEHGCILLLICKRQNVLFHLKWVTKSLVGVLPWTFCCMLFPISPHSLSSLYCQLFSLQCFHQLSCVLRLHVAEVTCFTTEWRKEMSSTNLRQQPTRWSNWIKTQILQYSKFMHVTQATTTR